MANIRTLCLLFILVDLQICLCVAQSVCSPVHFGWKCRLSCKCKLGDECDSSGKCKQGCPDESYGLGCLFDTTSIYDSHGKSYTGSVNKTKDGNQCLPWTNLRIVHIGYGSDNFPDGIVPGPYCRNPKDPKYGNYFSGPFCYVLKENQFTHEMCNLTKKECPDYLYGDGCYRECHCKNISELCEKSLGTCKSGCAPGWTGFSCENKCKTDRYGIECTESCGKCKNESCHHETGQCLEGCEAGFAGEFCKIRCMTGTYGEDCHKMCGKCLNKENCSYTDGICPNGCEDGYYGIQCNKRCPRGTYGRDCAFSCLNCHNRGFCHPNTGECEGGCIAGFTGPGCTQVCERGSYGENCSQTCGFCREHSCDTYTGHCVGGCEKGYEGTHCNQVEKPIVTIGASLIGGAIAGAIVSVVVILILIVVLLYRRRRFKKVLQVSRDQNGAGEQSFSPFTNRLKEMKENLLDTGHETERLLKKSPSIESCPLEQADNQINENQEPIYANVDMKNLSSPVKLKDLEEYIIVKKMIDSDGFKKEYGDLPGGLMALCRVALKPENKPKNRYNNIFAYDHSRVVLDPHPNDPQSDYVNASYIDGYNSPKAYIASQGPNKAMLVDFWRMVWQQKVCKIVMLTNLVETCKKKCEQYWPDEGSREFGEVTVEMLDTAEYTDYTIRSFRISALKFSRIIKQFHFTSWSDHGAPASPTPLLNFRRKVQQYSVDNSSPVLVHCSAGIGRTGTYIALDYLLKQAKAEEKVDVPQCVQTLRSNRVNMIQNWEQYVFVYEALLEAIQAGETTIPCSVLIDTYEEICTLTPGKSTTPLEDQFEILQKTCPILDPEDCKAALLAENISKNRFRNILPADRCRPLLYTQVEGYNDYINAVFLPGYTQRDAYIVTQMPLPNTVADFWRMLYDYSSDTVVMLNEFDRNDRSCALYWPEEYGYSVEYGPLSIELLFSSEADTNITVRTFKLSHHLKGEDKAVKQFQFNSWPDFKSVPNSTTAFIKLLDAVQEWTKQNGKGPVTVHCMNSASKSGLYCAVSLQLERMRVDHEVDIYQTVKQLRINRPQFIEDMEQYRFCYQMALTHQDRQ
ncbi:hypothetical protein CHS0354_010629 [Potamilus streckersoni]|uniref:protein-tyrosine-phosphatase n=1 Tax=Potamilus streckersoni TaxID=2493646 RepID=A0AAE0SG20_9BIVA|nr:hypothetical protein CHS0354_010629 [Potamilus streckersoni]